MASFLQRVLGLAPIESKAETGSGLFALQGFPMLSSLSNRPEKLIAEAEALFHSNIWVAACERAIVGRLASVEYHLEDENDDTIDADTSPLAASLIEVLNRPSPRRTRRQLWSITARHMGLTGNGFWYLSKRELLGGTPLECLYINPARMTPAEDSGGNLLGWIMDHPQNPLTPRGVTPTPFDLEEIIHFVLDEPDWGNYGIGIAETAQSKIELSRVTDRHAATTMGSGGRLAGIISPKAGGATISDDGWQAVIRDYRNIVSDPDSAKRVQVMRSPIDFTQTSADPAQMQLHDLMVGSRDDILGAWNVPQSQLGIIPARGLNSGDTPKFEEAQMWQGPINARLAPMIEKIQGELIDRWAALGLVAEIEVETPEFDDETPLYDLAEKAQHVPLTNDERRALVGKDPFEDPAFGAMVYLASNMGRIDSSIGSNLPTLAAPPAPLPAMDMAMLAEADMVKASPLQTLRHRTEVTWEPRIRAKVADVLRTQREEIAARIRSKYDHLLRKPTDTAMWWDSDKERLRLQHALEPTVIAMARSVARAAEERVPKVMRPAKAVPSAGYIDRVTNRMRARMGVRITGISDTTRDDISKLVQTGIEQGLGPSELADLISGATTFDEARAELISRTETMFAYNDAALGTYTELGATEVEAIDGDQDDECAERDGQVFSIDEADGITDHPNGTLDWLPVVPEGKAAPVPDVTFGLPSITIPMTVNVENPTPIVNVAAAEVNVPATIVNVEKPDATVVNVTVPEQPVTVNLPEAKASLPQEVIVTAMPPREHRVIRKKGEVTGSVETDV